MKKGLLYIYMIIAPMAIFAWTDNNEWQSGDSIEWDVPYQSQGYFRNWSTACMPTSGAMIVNFFYKGAPLKSFSDEKDNDKKHPWQDKHFYSPHYQTTGERIYAMGIITGNNYDKELKTYLKEYPKNGIPQYYVANISNKVGPLKNEVFGGYPSEKVKTKTSGGNTWGVMSSLIKYLDNKHAIETKTTDTDINIKKIRNMLYYGPILISIRRSDKSGGHIVVVKGVKSNGNLIINDPWGADTYSYPSLNGGNSKEYVVNGSYIKAYKHDHIINHGTLVPVIENFRRQDEPFSPYNFPIEATLKFQYDESGIYNENYDGDGVYRDIRNGFTYYPAGDNHKNWYYYYNQRSAVGFMYTKTTTNKPTTFARWTPVIPESGEYNVLVGFLPNSANTSEAHYTVYHVNGKTEKIINQKTSDNSYSNRGNIVYKSLGTYTFKKGEDKNTASVVVDNHSDVDGDINVDIVKFIPVKKDYYDGTGSLINAYDDCWGCNKDEADMHPHLKGTSSVSFQWLYDPAVCHHIDVFSDAYIDGGVTVYIKNWNKTESKKTYEINNFPISNVSEAKGISIETNTENPTSSNQKWNTILISTNKPLTYDVGIYAFCRSSSENKNLTDKKVLISKRDPNFSGYQWTGNGSLISKTSNDRTDGFGYQKDYALVPYNNKSVVTFQWYRNNDTCYQLKLTNGIDNNSASIKKVEIKQWSNSIWKTTKCTSLPCTLFSIFPKVGYAIVKIVSDKSKISKGMIQAKCINRGDN